MKNENYLWQKIVVIVGLLLIAAIVTFAAPKEKKGQKQPSAERITEIQTALSAHGFEPGRNWPETKEVCRKIAFDHGWQNMWAPDARVLILLGLTPKADQSVAIQPGNALDQDARKWVEEHGAGKIK
jgi:hypothetical protein